MLGSLLYEGVIGMTDKMINTLCNYCFHNSQLCNETTPLVTAQSLHQMEFETMNAQLVKLCM